MELAEGTKGTKGANGTKDTKDTSGPCDYPREGRRDPLELIPNPEQAKFIALGAQLVTIRDLCKQDLRFKVRPEEGLTQYKLDMCFYYIYGCYYHISFVIKPMSRDGAKKL